MKVEMDVRAFLYWLETTVKNYDIPLKLLTKRQSCFWDLSVDYESVSRKLLYDMVLLNCTKMNKKLQLLYHPSVRFEVELEPWGAFIVIHAVNLSKFSRYFLFL